MTSFEHSSPDPVDLPDCRLYVPEPTGWKAQILTSGEKVYCFAKNPGEDYYHLILDGEVFMQKGNEIFCLRCALRQNILTRDRLFWQHRVKKN
ncbi:hypothetical protein [Planctomicrobium piriforme]|uniref:Uncharacterized protein n=1 Tax=Planctomicrobium piriforme TaxID=1576369 RepID=A0A1I3BHF3_9PLAN|nr:hypothetical protein [Planctomicrobium piriforme]SFH61734.1 hypothetical protein SAMN05421753_101457 [Planctomicrobium piriforme]